MTTIDSSKVQQCCQQIVAQLDGMRRDNIVLPIHESWPAGLADAVLAHYGKFAARTADGIHVNAASLDRERRFNSMLSSMGVDPNSIPVIQLK